MFANVHVVAQLALSCAHLRGLRLGRERMGQQASDLKRNLEVDQKPAQGCKQGTWCASWFLVWPCLISCYLDTSTAAAQDKQETGTTSRPLSKVESRAQLLPEKGDGEVDSVTKVLTILLGRFTWVPSGAYPAYSFGTHSDIQRMTAAALLYQKNKLVRPCITAAEIALFFVRRLLCLQAERLVKHAKAAAEKRRLALASAQQAVDAAKKQLAAAKKTIKSPSGKRRDSDIYSESLRITLDCLCMHPSGMC